MFRLTTNKPTEEMDMVELAHNSCFVKDRQAMYRDYDGEYDARELAKKLLKSYLNCEFPKDNMEFDFEIGESLQNDITTIEGLIALFYRNLWAMAELHDRLKYYEDLEESGQMIIFPTEKKKEVFLYHIATKLCPKEAELKEKDCKDHGIAPDSVGTCVYCWERALNGVDHDNR